MTRTDGGPRRLTLSEINAWVASEMEQIPRAGFRQNVFRAVYQNLRAHSLGRKAERMMTAGEVYRWATETVRQQYPSFRPTYDPV